MKYQTIEYDEKGNYWFMEDPRQYFKSIESNLPTHVAHFFQHNFHDDSLSCALGDHQSNVELFGDYKSIVRLINASVRYSSILPVRKKLWILDTSIVANELLLSPRGGYIWNLFLDGGDHFSCYFRDIVPTHTNLSKEPAYRIQIGNLYKYYTGLSENDIGSGDYNQADRLYRQSLMAYKANLSYQMFCILTEQRFRLTPVIRMFLYGNKSMVFEFANHMSLIFTGISDLKVSEKPTFEFENIPGLKIWYFDDTPIWLYEELQVNGKFVLDIQLTNRTFSFSFVTVLLSSR
jgi:hypothetical protein